MKKAILIVLISIGCVYSYAQIGIGTTSPNSTLDVRGSLSLNYRAFTASTTATATDNTLMFTGGAASTLTLPDATTCTGREYIIKNISTTLPVPVVTIATAFSQTIDSRASWLLDELQETITIISNGISWNIMASGTIKTRTNFVLIQSSTDFPVPVSGVITLVAGTTYEVNGTITMTNMINLNGCHLIGMDVNNDKLRYTPATGELFTGTKGGTIRNLTLTANTTGAKLFNINMAATENLVFRENNVDSCKDIGLVRGGNIVFFHVVQYSANTIGITYQDNNDLIIDFTIWLPNNSNTFEKMVGTFDVIKKLGGYSEPMSGLSAVALHISGITAINVAGSLSNAVLLGTGTKVAGTFSSKWDVESIGISTEKDNEAHGNIYISTVVNTTFSAINTPTKMLGSTTAASMFRTTMPANNRLTYTGTKTRRFLVTGSLTASQVSSSNDYTFYIYKNGVQLPESKQTIRLVNSTDQNTVSITCTVSMATNDYIEVWAATSPSNYTLIVKTMNLSIR